MKPLIPIVLGLISSTVLAVSPKALIRSDYKEGEVTKLCQAAIQKARARLDALTKLPPAERTLQNTLLEFEASQADLSDESTPLAFMGQVSTNEKMAAEGTKCEEELGQFDVETFSRRDVYQALTPADARSPEDARLKMKTIEAFEMNGLKLSDEKLAQVKKLRSELTTLETQFGNNLNNDKSFVTFTADELKGVPDSVLAKYKKDADGKYIVTTKVPDAVPVLENATSSETRKKMSLAYLTRGGTANLELLQKALPIRAEIAKLLGYKNWAAYKTSNRMAKDDKTVNEFLKGLRQKLSQRNQADLALLLKFKKEIEPGAKKLNSWDLSYLAYQLQKRDYQLDDEKIREYFPADVVIAGLFQVYSKMLGVTFQEVKDAPVWAPNVHLYEIHEATDKKLIGYFYTDFFPRPGKYGHAAAFTLFAGRRLANGSYNLPTAAIVANFNAPTADKPSLLNHDEVETVFHEFGHIMHQTLTRAPYASLAGSSVARDFVEAPSQMLENWVWSPQILPLLSGHYQDHSKKLPPDLLERMLKVRDFNKGVFYTRQLLFGLFDMSLHTQNKAVPPNQIYEKLYREIVGVEPLKGQHFPSTFGHLMGGYDAGYYGYLWSDVYAQDMFSKFPPDNLTSPEVGGRYRKIILESGKMREPQELLVEFLGRPPQKDAFFKKLNIK